jgi:hypothetical protein
MPISETVEAVKEHFVGAIVLSLYFFHLFCSTPAEYVESYSSWPQTKPFIIWSSIFLVFVFFLAKLFLKHLHIPRAAALSIIGDIYKKFATKLCPYTSRIASVIQGHIAHIIIVGSLISGVGTISSISELSTEFVNRNNPFFPIYLDNYCRSLIYISLLLFFASKVFKYIYKTIEKS